jgi:hypothetical protein
MVDEPMQPPSVSPAKPRDPKARRRIAIAFLLLAAFMIAGAFGVRYAADLVKQQDIIAARENQSALQGIAEPKALDEALRQHPQNKLLQMIAMAAKAANDTDATFDQWSNAIELPSIAKGVTPGAVSRGDLEALQRDLKTAETNATALLPRTTALLKTERDSVEKNARALTTDKDVMGRLMDGVDKHHAELTALTSRLLSARADYYRSYQAYVAVLTSEFGSYRVVDGQFIFPFQRTVDRYNVAAHAMTETAKRVGELQEETARLVKAQQEGWEKVVGGK